MNYRKHLLEGGVKNLREFGYPGVTVENILTVTVYKQFFKRMLEENLTKNKGADPAIQELLKEIG